MFRRLFAPLAALALLAACATSDPVDPNDMTRSVVFGHIDMEDAPSDVDWVFIMLYDGEQEGFTSSATDGYFYHLGITPGPYQIDSFGAYPGFLNNTSYTYEFGADGRNESATRVAAPGAYFMGSHRYIAVDAGWFEQAKFEIETTAQPSEREILTRVLADMQTNYPEYVHQIGLVRQRLAELN